MSLPVPGILSYVLIFPKKGNEYIAYKSLPYFDEI